MKNFIAVTVSAFILLPVGNLMFTTIAGELDDSNDGAIEICLDGGLSQEDCNELFED